MSEFKFNCPHCAQHLAATEEIIGHQIQCPACSLALTIPAPPRAAGQPGKAPPVGGLHLSGSGAQGTASPPIAPAPSSAPNLGRCRQCGKVVPTGTVFCSSCGTPVMGTNAQLESSSPIPSNVAAGLCYLGGIVIPAVLLASRLSAMASASATPHGLAFPQASFFGGTQLLSATGPWVVGLIFLLIDKRPFVRFHAAQSIAWFVGVMVLNFLASIILGFAMSSMWQPTPGAPGVMPNFTMLRIVGTLGSLLQLAIYIVTFIAMISAFVGKKYYLPGVGDMVEGWVGKN